jgi:hypothetical protein
MTQPGQSAACKIKKQLLKTTDGIACRRSLFQQIPRSARNDNIVWKAPIVWKDHIASNDNIIGKDPLVGKDHVTGPMKQVFAAAVSFFRRLALFDSFLMHLMLYFSRMREVILPQKAR